MKPILRRISSLLSVIFLLSFCVTNASANEYYWVGGTGNWSDFSHHWATTSGGSSFYLQVPQSVDNVHFDVNSGFTTIPANKTVTIDVVTASANDIDWTGAANTPVFNQMTGGILNVSGSFTLIPAMTIGFTSTTNILNFIATSAGKTISTFGKSMGNSINFSGVGGGWTMQSPFVTTNVINLVAGTWNTNSQAVSALNFTSTGAGIRSLVLGSTVFTVSYSGNGGAGWIVSGTGISVTPGTSNIIHSGSGPIPTFTGGAVSYYDVTWTAVTGVPIATFSGGTGYHNVRMSCNGTISSVGPMNGLTFLKNGTITASNSIDSLSLAPNAIYTFTNGTTQTVKALDATGNCNGVITMQSSAAGSQATISQASGTDVLSYVSMQDMNYTGGTLYTANNSINGGNNTGITINTLTSRNLYWIGNSGNWSDGTHWSLTSNGPASGCAPTEIDNVFFDAASFTLANQIVTLNVTAATVNNVDWTGVTNTPTFTCLTTNALYVAGSYILSPAMNLNYTGTINFISNTPGQTISTFGKIQNTVNFAGAGGGWTLQSEFKANSTIILNNGALNTNSQPVTALAFQSALTATRSLTLVATQFTLTNTSLGITSSVTSWNVTATGLTLNAGTSNLVFTNNAPGTAIMISGNGLTYYDLTWTGPLATFGQITGSLNGNNFHDVKFASQGFLNTTASTYNSVTFSKSGIIGGISTTFGNTIKTLDLSPGYTYQFLANGIQTIGTLTAPGTCNAFIELQSTSAGIFATISRTAGSTNLVLDYLSLKDIQKGGTPTPDIAIISRSTHLLHVRFTGSVTAATGMIPAIGRSQAVV
jgi:hypothetical protein